MFDDVGIFAEAARLSQSGLCFAIASITAVSGSTPRSSARMLIRADATILGTIGGGVVESKVIADALTCMKTGKPTIARYDLDASAGKVSTGMLCGGSLEVFIDVVPSRRRLIIVGAGHVGQALAKIADFCGFSVFVVDERADMATKQRFPTASALYGGKDLVEALNQLPIDPEAAFVVATHADDERAVRALLSKPWSYLGMMGSRKKVKTLMEKIKGEGCASDILAKIRAPIGIDIEAETPEEIAVAIISEIIADSRHADCCHLAAKTE